jgi:O-antigen ligase
MLSAPPIGSPHSASRSLRGSPKWGVAGVCLYIVGFALPLHWGIALGCVTLLTQRRRRLFTGLGALLALLLVTLLLNALFFPNAQLVDKVIRSDYGTLSGRTPVWAAAWTLFLDAPVLGHARLHASFSRPGGAFFLS